MISERDLPGLLPSRYDCPWRRSFEAEAEKALVGNAAILDLGSGRNPVFPAGSRPATSTYVGLDLSEDELRAAPPGSYNEIVVADAAECVPDLRSRFDLAVSYQVLEHIHPLDRCISNIRSYLKPGGLFVALLSGRFSAFGILNRLLPGSAGEAIATRVMRRTESEDPVFRAPYHQCYDSALRGMFEPWSSGEVRALYRGGVYFHFSSLALRAYLAYENFVAGRELRNLATHYLVVARR